MRIFLRNDSASRGLPCMSASGKRGVVVQVLGAGTLWFANDRSILENTDSSGIPTAGNSITSADGAVIFEQWNDEFWMRGSVLGVAAEINTFEVR